VKIEVVGFASSSEFKEPIDCGPDIKSSDPCFMRTLRITLYNELRKVDHQTITQWPPWNGPR
jgi:hypothetical protein